MFDSQCCLFSRVYPGPVQDMSILANGPRTLHMKLRKMQLSALHTKIFFNNCNDFFNSFLYEQRFCHRLFQKNLCSFVCSVYCVRALKPGSSACIRIMHVVTMSQYIQADLYVSSLIYITPCLCHLIWAKNHRKDEIKTSTCKKSSYVPHMLTFLIIFVQFWVFGKMLILRLSSVKRMKTQISPN